MGFMSRLTNFSSTKLVIIVNKFLSRYVGLVINQSFDVSAPSVRCVEDPGVVLKQFVVISVSALRVYCYFNERLLELVTVALWVVK